MQVERKGKYIRRTFYTLAGILFVILILIISFKLMVQIKLPSVPNIDTGKFIRNQVDSSGYKIGDNWVRKSKSGLWEMYLSGNPYELGLKNGILSKELISYQEIAFIDRIKELIPSECYLKFLRYAIAWFNKDLDEYIPLENQQEIYGISQSADPQYGFIGNNYERILNYHAAHDIGHAMQNLNLVACTAFGVWDEYSSDSSLMIGRNFDFYVGDAFAQNKIVAFYHPETGFDFAMVTWGGMTGVVSGMNREGLTITLNAAKSEIPFGARTPVSIVARKILQYASNIKEAYEIAAGMETFVCETFLTGSAKDGNAAIIEKTPDTTVLYKSPSHFIIATNHLQHSVFANHKLNIENMENETSVYRFNRVKELIAETQKFDPGSAASLLRNQEGSSKKNIGMGNEKAVNQLIAHHSVIFKPEQRLMWVSTHPYQLGQYVCYDLEKIFDEAESMDIKNEIILDSLTIPADSFLFSVRYQNFEKYKKMAHKLKNNPAQISPSDIEQFLSLNPEYFHTYELAGDFYAGTGNKEKSADFYNFALSKEISSAADRMNISNKLSKLNSDTRNREKK
jgi:hypothetical protein